MAARTKSSRITPSYSWRASSEANLCSSYPLTVQDLAAAPDDVRRRLAAVPEAHIETLQLDAEAKELAEA